MADLILSAAVPVRICHPAGISREDLSATIRNRFRGYLQPGRSWPVLPLPLLVPPDDGIAAAAVVGDAAPPRAAKGLWGVKTVTGNLRLGRIALAPELPRGQIPRADVATAVAESLEPPATIGKQWELVSGETSIREALEKGEGAETLIHSGAKFGGQTTWTQPVNLPVKERWRPLFRFHHLQRNPLRHRPRGVKQTSPPVALFLKESIQIGLKFFFAGWGDPDVLYNPPVGQHTVPATVHPLDHFGKREIHEALQAMILGLAVSRILPDLPTYKKATVKNLPSFPEKALGLVCNKDMLFQEVLTIP